MMATLTKLRTLAGKVRVWGVAGIAAYVRRTLSQRRHRRLLLAMHRRAGAEHYSIARFKADADAFLDGGAT